MSQPPQPPHPIRPKSPPDPNAGPDPTSKEIAIARKLNERERRPDRYRSQQRIDAKRFYIEDRSNPDPKPTFSDEYKESSRPYDPLPLPLQRIFDSTEHGYFKQKCCVCHLNRNSQLQRLCVSVDNAPRGSLHVQAYPPTFRVQTCGHVFHEACLLNWLMEGLTVTYDVVWGQFDVHGGVRDVPETMRGRVACMKCEVCCDLRALVGMSGVGVVEVEDVMRRVEGKNAENLGGQTAKAGPTRI